MKILVKNLTEAPKIKKKKKSREKDESFIDEAAILNQLDAFSNVTGHFQNLISSLTKTISNLESRLESLEKIVDDNNESTENKKDQVNEDEGKKKDRINE